MCSGSGCIAITLAHLYPQAQVYGVEQSPEALDYFQRNVALHRLQDRVTVIQGDARAPLDLPLVDLLVSNPPYVSEVEMAHLQREVQFEPAMALQAPEEGLHFYRCFLERDVYKRQSLTTSTTGRTSSTAMTGRRPCPLCT